MKMAGPTAEYNMEPVLVLKCLELASALSRDGRPFLFTIKMDSFTFSLDTKEIRTPGPIAEMKKKKKMSPQHSQKECQEDADICGQQEFFGPREGEVCGPNK